MIRYRLTPSDARWAEFTKRLEGPEGCNFHDDENGKIVWTCQGGHNQDLARAILLSMSDVDVEATLAFCTEHGGHCDCEILFNVENSYQNPAEWQKPHPDSAWLLGLLDEVQRETQRQNEQDQEVQNRKDAKAALIERMALETFKEALMTLFGPEAMDDLSGRIIREAQPRDLFVDFGRYRLHFAYKKDHFDHQIDAWVYKRDCRLTMAMPELYVEIYNAAEDYYDMPEGFKYSPRETAPHLISDRPGLVSGMVELNRRYDDAVQVALAAQVKREVKPSVVTPADDKRSLTFVERQGQEFLTRLLHRLDIRHELDAEEWSILGQAAHFKSSEIPF